MTAAVLRPTTAPRRALLLTTTYGTPILRQSAGRKTTSSIGSTERVSDDLVVPRRTIVGDRNERRLLRLDQAARSAPSAGVSTHAVTWFRPDLTKTGFLSDLRASAADLPDAIASASLSKRAFFSGRVSGRILFASLNSAVAVLRRSVRSAT